MCQGALVGKHCTRGLKDSVGRLVDSWKKGFSWDSFGARLFWIQRSATTLEHTWALASFSSRGFGSWVPTHTGSPVWGREGFLSLFLHYWPSLVSTGTSPDVNRDFPNMFGKSTSSLGRDKKQTQQILCRCYNYILITLKLAWIGYREFLCARAN